MNRRLFLQRICGGVVAAAVVTRFPLSWVPESIRREGAIKFMRDAYNAYMKGKRSRDCPNVMFAGGDLWDAYRAEVVANMRLSGNGFYGPWTDASEPRENLMFKAGRLIRASDSGWWFRILENS